MRQLTMYVLCLIADSADYLAREFGRLRDWADREIGVRFGPD